MKKILTLCLVALFAITLSSCGEKTAMDASVDVLKKGISMAKDAKTKDDVKNVSIYVLTELTNLRKEYKDYVPSKEDEAKLKPYTDELRQILDEKTKEVAGAE